MVSRRRVGRVAWLAATCMAAGLASPVQSQEFGAPGGTLVWGGQMPEPGQGYRPSMSAVDMFGDGSSAPAQPPVGNAYQGNAAIAAPVETQRVMPSATIAPPPLPKPQAIAQPQPTPQIIPQTMPTAPLAADLAPVMAPPSQIPATPPANIETVFGGTYDPGLPDASDTDPWGPLKAVTPGAVTEADRLRIERALKPARKPERPQLASVAPERKPLLRDPQPRRGTLVEKTPFGWKNLPYKEALCRAALKDIGVEFTDRPTIDDGKNCGVQYPVKVSQIAPGVAIRPAATLNCDAAFRISRWMQKEVQPAARSKLWTGVSTVINSSSYRCSRVAGSGGISEHASGNALDVAGFKLANGKIIDIQEKGVFSFSEKAFQKDVRQSACNWFGTVLGPGYNYDHRHHFHLDARKRKSVVCK